MVLLVAAFLSLNCQPSRPPDMNALTIIVVDSVVDITDHQREQDTTLVIDSECLPAELPTLEDLVLARLNEMSATTVTMELACDPLKLPADRSGGPRDNLHNQDHAMLYVRLESQGATQKIECGYYCGVLCGRGMKSTANWNGAEWVLDESGMIYF